MESIYLVSGWFLTLCGLVGDFIVVVFECMYVCVRNVSVRVSVCICVGVRKRVCVCV